MPINRDELVRAIAARGSMQPQEAEAALSNVLGELAAAQIFEPGADVPSLLSNNRCTNNCPAQQ